MIWESREVNLVHNSRKRLKLIFLFERNDTPVGLTIFTRTVRLKSPIVLNKIDALYT